VLVYPIFSFSSVCFFSFYIFFACFFVLIFYILCFFPLSDLQLFFMLVNSYLISFLPIVFRRTFNPPLTSFLSLSFSYSSLLNVKIKRSLTKVGNFHYIGFLVVKRPLACDIMSVVRTDYMYRFCPSYAKLSASFKLMPKVFKFSLSYAKFINFSPLMPKSLGFANLCQGCHVFPCLCRLMPNFSRFAQIMPNVSTPLLSCQFIKFCQSYPIIFNYADL
jgi:hypothetical protein